MIAVEGLAKRYRRHRRDDGPTGVDALADVTFEVGAGEMLVLLGPSGCGKTTTLRCLAGLEEPDAGRVRLGERVVVDVARGINVATHRRGVGLVFQSFALWPHLSVRGNIGYPLKVRRHTRTHRTAAVDEVARLVELDPVLLDQRPGRLSGGQQQRVALARALVARPEVILFDEPLSNLDAPLREQLRTELRLLHRRLGFTAVYVTHDLQEARVLGDRLAVMDEGRIAQAGPVADVLERPRSAAVARLLGFRPVARLVQRPEGWSVAGGEVSGALPPVDGAPPVVDLYARPEAVGLAPSPGGAPEAGVIRVGGAVVQQADPVGRHTGVVLSRAGPGEGREEGRLRLEVHSPDVGAWQVGASVAVEVAAVDVCHFTHTGDVWLASAASPRGDRGASRARGAS